MAKKLAKSSDVNIEKVISKIQLGDVPKEDMHIVSDVILGVRKDLHEQFEFNETMVLMQKVCIEKAEEKCLDSELDVKEHTRFLERKRNECLAAENEVAKAREQLEKAKKALYAAEKFHAQLERKLEMAKEDCQYRKNVLEQMLVIALVHSTASLKQIREYRLADIIITNSEEQLLEYIDPDEVFDAENAEHFVERLPRGFEEKYDKATRQAMIDYCELVINFKMAEDTANTGLKIVCLFSSQDIAEILRLNGLEEF
jgi:hypothetical protein